MIEQVSTYINVAVVVIGAVYGLWDWLRHGFTRQVYSAVRQVPEIAEMQNEMCKTQDEIRAKQDDLSHTVFLLVLSRRHDEVSINEQALLEEIDAGEWRQYVDFTDDGTRVSHSDPGDD